VEVVERTASVAGVEVRWLATLPEPAGTPALLLHGVPNSAEMWLPLLERRPAIALDLPGFGKSAKPGNFDYSIGGYERFLEAFLDHLELERAMLVMHDWGGVGLALAQRNPERVERLVALCPVPFLPGYRWHRIARAWRRPLVGELVMGLATRRGLKRAFAVGSAGGTVPDEFVDEIWEHFDHGTQRAILRLYRSASERQLARAGERLGEVRCPALILWGERDPYLPPELADQLGAALGGEARVVRLPDAGHWVWLDRPDAIDLVADFLSAS
jgi:pimeloyl-ACP methyl ester carboxylesterase